MQRYHQIQDMSDGTGASRNPQARVLPCSGYCGFIGPAYPAGHGFEVLARDALRLRAQDRRNAMPLQSQCLKGDSKLEAAAVSDPAHILTGAVGAHVAKIQQALMVLDNASIAASELAARQYGESTASAVLAFKQKRNIINRSYQSQADNIVGKMTMAALDQALAQRERTLTIDGGRCHFGGDCGCR
jgi:hypothetical protein